jgi:transcriptional regulator with XRE-family HTH domain
MYCSGMEQGWAAQEARAIGERVAARRRALGLSQEALAGRCAQLGLPSVSRQSLARLEGGKREGVTTAELAALAAALRVSPVELLYPFASAAAEFLPGQSAPPWQAAQWWSGEVSLAEDGLSGQQRPGPATLYKDHVVVLAAVGDAAITEADYASLRRRQLTSQGLSDSERALMMAVVALQEIRRELTDESLPLPPLPAGLKWLDS